MFRSCVKSALTLVASMGLPEIGLEQAWRYVATGNGIEVNILLAANAPPWTPETDLGPVSHLLAVSSSSRDRTIRMHMGLFGGVWLAGTLASGVQANDWAVGYAIDPLTGNEDQTTRLDGDLIDPNSRRKDVEEAFSKAFEVIRQTGYQRGAATLAAEISTELMAKHFGPPRSQASGDERHNACLPARSSRRDREHLRLSIRSERNSSASCKLVDMLDLILLRTSATNS